MGLLNWLFGKKPKVPEVVQSHVAPVASEQGREEDATIADREARPHSESTNCAVCFRKIPASQLRPSELAHIFGMLPAFQDLGKKMPDVMQELAMKCNRCGVWICSKCASNAAMAQGAGMIQHSDCGGIFETP